MDWSSVRNLLCAAQREHRRQASLSLSLSLSLPPPPTLPRSGVMRTRKLRSPLLRTPFFVNDSPFKACSRSQCSYACFAHQQKFLPLWFLPSRSIQLHLRRVLSFHLLPYRRLVNVGSRLGPRTKNRPPCSSCPASDAGSRIECPRNTNMLQNMCWYASRQWIKHTCVIR